MTQIIVSGGDALSSTLIEELTHAGLEVTSLDDSGALSVEAALSAARVRDAHAVICAGPDDAHNLEVALLARRANPEVRVVARLTNDVLRQAAADGNGPGAILNVAELAAPSVVKACLGDATYSFDAAGTPFTVCGHEAPRAATLDDLYGQLAYVAVVHGENSSTPGELAVCPDAGYRVDAGDWVVMVGSPEEVAVAGVATTPSRATPSRQKRFGRGIHAVRALFSNVNPAFYPVLAAVVALVGASTLVLRLGHRSPPMGWVDALYFTVETITTTGYGDFAFIDQPLWLRLFAVALMFSGATTVALLVAFVADVMLSQRFLLLAAHPRIGHLRGHVVVVGLSALGMRVVTELIAAGYQVAVIERDEENAMLPAARDLKVPIVFGDATVVQTLRAARVAHARAVAVLTRDDMVNIETGMVAAQLLGRRLGPTHHRPDVPLVLRVYDRALGVALAQRFGFVNTRSTVELAAPWFIGAAIGLRILDTFSVGQRSFVIGAILVAGASDLDGVPLSALTPRIQALAVSRPGGPFIPRPRREIHLSAGDTVYLVGPYRDVLGILQKGGHSQMQPTTTVQPNRVPASHN